MQKRRVLVLDIGGTSVKLHIAGMEEPLRLPSGRKMTPERMISEIQKAAASGRPEFDAISVGMSAGSRSTANADGASTWRMSPSCSGRRSDGSPDRIGPTANQ